MSVQFGKHQGMTQDASATERRPLEALLRALSERAPDTMRPRQVTSSVVTGGPISMANQSKVGPFGLANDKPDETLRPFSRVVPKPQ